MFYIWRYIRQILPSGDGVKSLNVEDGLISRNSELNTNKKLHFAKVESVNHLLWFPPFLICDYLPEGQNEIFNE